MSELTIGQVSKRAAVPASTIRYYERERLLPQPHRQGGQRRYDESVFGRLTLIGLGKSLGFSLTEIKTLVDGVASGDKSPKRLRALAELKLPEIEATLTKARLMKRLLTAVSECACPDLNTCIKAAKRVGVLSS